MEQFRISLAGLTVEIHSRYPLARTFCKDYLEGSTGIHFSADAVESEIAEQMCASEISDEPHAELMCLHRSIAERLPRFERCLLHGAAISYKGKAYLFLAPAGTGKSTHIRLWRECIGQDVGIVNGDKPILDLSGALPLVCGTPWAGKEGWQKNVSVPLAAVCLLQRGETDSIRRVQPKDHLAAVLQQVYRPDDPAALTATFSLLDRLFANVPLYLLSCTPRESAVRTAFPALTGEEYPKGESNEN